MMTIIENLTDLLKIFYGQLKIKSSKNILTIGNIYNENRLIDWIMNFLGKILIRYRLTKNKAWLNNLITNIYINGYKK